MLSGDALSQWLQRQHTGVVRGSLVRLTPSGLPQVSSALDSHPVTVLLPVLRGGQAAVARAVPAGAEGPELALRVQAVSDRAERVRQMERLVTMLTVAEATRADPARYPAVLPVLESFVVTLTGDQVPVAHPAARYELWCDVTPWCPTSLAHARRDDGASAAPTAVAQILPLVRTVLAVHEHLNVVHRDITPNNVLVDAAGRLLLADWGIAHTVTGGQTSTRTELVGNRGFSLPPEMLAGDQAVGRYTDAWYLGCLLVWMLTGQAPGPRHGPGLLPPGLPGGQAGDYLDGVVQGLCEPDPRRRMPLAEALRRLDHLALAGPADWGPPQTVRQTGPAAAAHTSPAGPGHVAAGRLATEQRVEPVARASRRRWRPVAAVVGAVVAAAAVVVGWHVTHQDAGVASPSPTATSCWDDLAAGRCPDVDANVLANAFPVKDGVPEPDYAEYTVDIDADPGDPGGNWIVDVEWADEGLAAYLDWYPDSAGVVEHYQRYGYEQDAAGVPGFADGPGGPTFSLAHGQTLSVAYCYAEAPICLETAGTPDTITRTTDRFGSLTSSQIRYLVSLAE